MAKQTTVTVKPALAVITPYALARMSRHMFGASVDYRTDDRVPLIKYYLFCASIELGLKSAILADDCTNDRKKFLRNKVGHNLIKVVTECEGIHKLDFLDEEDLKIIEKINPYFKGKGLEYFTIEMMEAALTGYTKLPAIDDLQRVAQKVQDFLEGNKYFIDGQTSDQPKGGLINFV